MHTRGIQKVNYWLICSVGISLSYGQMCLAGGFGEASPIVIKVHYQKEFPQQRFAVSKLAEATAVVPSNDPAESNIVVLPSTTLGAEYCLHAHYATIKPEGYCIERLAHDRIAVLSTDQTGAMYGILDIAEQIQLGKNLETLEEKRVTPGTVFRGIKFNLPWNSYRRDESLQLHEKTIRDLRYWKRFLDMMAENRLNALTLWNLHPFTYMIRAKNFPEACPFSDEELRVWQEFWHGLLTMASERGIKTYVVNWNIFVSNSFARKHGVARYCLDDFEGKDFIGKGDYSPLIQQYTRESVVQLIEEYPELTGIGVSQNERMEGVPEEVWQDWIVDTYFDAMDSAKRKIEFIIRAHTHPAPELTRKAVENNAHRLGTVYVDVKFNWSHAHASPDLMYIHGGSRSTALWEPKPQNYRMIFTMRNEDFFVLRWGEPDFIREVLRRNLKEYVGGYLIGSETYIPGKEYIARAGKNVTWGYAFERQWLFYKVWGRLMYDPKTQDDVFANAFNTKYGITYGNRLIEAHKLADRMPLRLASFYASTWDFSLYSEGFLANAPSRTGCFYDSVSPFISVDEIIGTTTLDTNLVSIKDFVAGKFSGSPKIDPLTLAAELQKNGNDALSLVRDLRTTDPTLQHEIADIKTWSYLSLYFGEKLRGGTALQHFRMTGDSGKQKESIRHLEAALKYWEEVVAITRVYVDEIPLMHLNPKYVNSGNSRPLKKFSWANLTDEVRNDIEIARRSRPKTP